MSEVTIPIEHQIDKYHPDNQPFMQLVNQNKRLIVHHTAMCRPAHIEILKLHIKGRSNVDIAEHMKRSQGNISLILRRPEVQKLKQSLTHLATLYEGPSIEMRKRYLWEVAIDNKEDDPRVGIQALKEMNSIDGVGKEKQESKIEITINTANFPRGTLDD
jgi:hypothetical protein